MSFRLFLREKIFLDSKIKKFFTDILIYPRLILEDNSEINILPGDKNERNTSAVRRGL